MESVFCSEYTVSHRRAEGVGGSLTLVCIQHLIIRESKHSVVSDSSSTVFICEQSSFVSMEAQNSEKDVLKCNCKGKIGSICQLLLVNVPFSVGSCEGLPLHLLYLFTLNQAAPK